MSVDQTKQRVLWDRQRRIAWGLAIAFNMDCDWLIRGKPLHTRNQHLRNHHDISVAFSNGLSVAFSNLILLFSGIFQRSATFPVDFHCNCHIDFPWHFPIEFHFCDIWRVIFCPSWCVMFPLSTILIMSRPQRPVTQHMTSQHGALDQAP